MRTTLVLIALFMAADLHAAQWKQTLVIDDHTIAIHLDELNKARFPSLGNGRDGAIDSAPLDVTMAADPASYTVDGKHPAALGERLAPTRLYEQTGLSSTHWNTSYTCNSPSRWSRGNWSRSA